MPDTITPVAVEITRLITAGVAEQALLATVARAFPDLTPAAALQEATAEAERRALRPH